MEWIKQATVELQTCSAARLEQLMEIPHVPAHSAHERRLVADATHALRVGLAAAHARLYKEEFSFVGEPHSAARVRHERPVAETQTRQLTVGGPASAAWLTEEKRLWRLVCADEARLASGGVFHHTSLHNAAAHASGEAISVVGARDCLLILHATGSVYLEDARGCVVYARAQQVRIKSSSGCTVVAGSAVIEDCTDMQMSGAVVDFGVPAGASDNVVRMQRRPLTAAEGDVCSFGDSIGAALARVVLQWYACTPGYRAGPDARQ